MYGHPKFGADTDLSLHELFLNAVTRANPSAIAFQSAVTGQQVTFPQVVEIMEQFKRTFYHDFGIRKGSVVMFLSPNSLNYASIFHAILSLGAIVSTANPVMTESEIARQIELSGATLLVTVSVLHETIDKALEIVSKQGKTCRALYHDKPLREGLQLVPLEATNFERRADDTIVVPFSSGTTGMPKGVQLTNKNLVSNLVQSQVACNFNQGDVMLAVLPYFHIYGMIVILHLMLYTGGKQIVFPKFEMELYLKQLAEQRATLAFVAPPLIVGMIKHPMTKQIDTSSVRWLFSGAAPLSEKVQKMAEPLFPKSVIGQGYGLTETSPVVCVAPQEAIKYGSCGTLVSDTEVRLVRTTDSENGAELFTDAAVGQEGELWVRGPQVMKGYLRQEDTDVVLPRAAEGFFRTGDLARIDADGDIFVTERIKELIKVKGFQVAPAELEAILQQHEAVQEAIVVGVSDDMTGEVPKAHVVLKPDALKDGDITEHDVVASIELHVNKNVSFYKRITGGIRVVQAIPKTASGKLLRRVVRDMETSKK